MEYTLKYSRSSECKRIYLGDNSSEYWFNIQVLDNGDVRITGNLDLDLATFIYDEFNEDIIYKNMNFEVYYTIKNLFKVIGIGKIEITLNREDIDTIK